MASPLSTDEIAARFRELTLTMYTTSISLADLKEKVYPYLAPDVEFIDPWIKARGAGLFRNGLRGFHCIIYFDFEIFQIGVEMNDRGDGGRVIVDGVMNLQQLRVYTYPLRTILIYDFRITPGGERIEITRLEEMWSYADMIQNTPILGRLYDVSRFFGGYFFTAVFWLGCKLKKGVSVTLPRRSPST